jgi:transcription elongation factor Elf1
MPKYRFFCKMCNEERSQYVDSSVLFLPCETCGGNALRQMPKLTSETEVREVIDPLTNTKWQQDQKDMIQARRDQHYWDVDVPRLVQTHSLETCLDQGWLIYNDKGELVVNKPPSKR